jgi:hypothetical protein
MLVTPYGLGLGRAGTDPQTPILRSVTPFKVDTATDWANQTVAGLTPATGNLVAVLAAWSNDATPVDFSGVTWAGATVTEIGEAKVSAQFTCHVWAGWIADGVAELGDLVVSSGSGDHRDLIGWLLAFDRFAGSPIGPSPLVTAVRTIQAAQSIPIPVSNPKSILIGFAAAVNENLHPMTASAGWTVRGTDRTGNSSTGDLAAMVATKAATAIGTDTLTATAAGSLTTDDWGGVGIELLPY